MMHTEDEARQKWCPFARVVEYDSEGSEPIEGYPVGNRSTPFRGQTYAHPYARCIASQCMAWRWKVGPPTAQERASYKETSDQRDWRGYCGLAGKDTEQ